MATKKVGSTEGKVPSWAWNIPLILIAIGLLTILASISYKYIPSWDELSSNVTSSFVHKTNGAVTNNAYNFPNGVNRLDLSLAPGETSQWIATPPQSEFRIDSGDKPMRICYLDGSCHSLGAKDVSYTGIKRGVFQISAGEEATQVVVTIER